MLAAVVVVLAIACGGSNKELTETEYLESVSQINNPSLDAYHRIEDLLNQVINRPALISNSTWEADFAQAVSEINNNLIKARKIDPPAALEKAHRVFLQALECMADSPPKVRSAIESRSASDLASATDFASSCGDLWGDALDALKDATGS